MHGLANRLIARFFYDDYVDGRRKPRSLKEPVCTCENRGNQRAAGKAQSHLDPFGRTVVRFEQHPSGKRPAKIIGVSGLSPGYQGTNQECGRQPLCPETRVHRLTSPRRRSSKLIVWMPSVLGEVAAILPVPAFVSVIWLTGRHPNRQARPNDPSD